MKKLYSKKFLKDNYNKKFSTDKNQYMSFVGFKKAFISRDEWQYNYEECIVCLYVPRNAMKRGNFNYKIRVSEAKVLWIKSLITNKKIKKAYSGYDHSFTYEMGKTVKPKKTFAKSNKSCASGVHLFLNKESAEQYIM